MAEVKIEQAGNTTGEEPGIVTGSLSLGLLLTITTSVLLVRFEHVGWCWGFSVGAGISLISLFSLGTVVPRLSMPNAPAASQFLLALVLFLKLPLYTIALYAVTRMPGVDARSAFPGIMVAPLAITIKVVGALVRQAASEAVYRRQIRRGGAVVMGSTRGKLFARSRPIVETVTEQG